MIQRQSLSQEQVTKREFYSRPVDYIMGMIIGLQKLSDWI